MNILQTDLPVVYLKQGEMYFAEEPALITTVLGSCLSAAMFNSRLRLGALCHGMLPRCPGADACSADCNEGFKYVACSIRRMVARFAAYGVRREELEVKLFGGADMFNTADRGDGVITVGRQNIAAAMELIGVESLRVSALDVGGLRGRKIFFYSHTGEVALKRLRPSDTVIPASEGLYRPAAAVAAA